MQTKTITLGGKEYTVTRAKLKRWVELESLKSKALELAKRGRAMELCDTILSYISLSTGLAVEELDKYPWIEIVNAWHICLELNVPNHELPIYKVQSNIKDKKAVWDYEGRTWYIWANNIASRYGWTLEYIAELEVDDASALLEEIFVDEQLEKEFIWMTSEIAYPYNEGMKKHEFKPLPRPAWMMDEIRIFQQNGGKIPNVKIRKDHMPVGLILRGKERVIN